MRHEIEFVLALLLAVALLARLARRINVAYPIVLVLGGLGIAFIPGAPDLQLDPEVVYLVFLPPLLYVSAFFSSPQELREHARPITLLAVGLVLATIGAVAVVAHYVAPGLGWPAAFVLGAILGPTDPVAPAAVFERLGGPRRIVTIVEGESLVNDGVGLSAYHIALGVVLAGTFSPAGAVLDFVRIAGGGVVIGLLVGWVVKRVRSRLDDPQVEITISLFTPYAAFLPAEELGVSGILAAVTAGLFLGAASPGLFTPGTRLQAYAFWDVLAFLLNSAVFVLMGLQLRGIAMDLSAPLGQPIAYAALIAGVVIIVRLAWMFTVPWFVRTVRAVLQEQLKPSSSRERLLLGWCGMRGAVSLVLALSLPPAFGTVGGLSERELLVFVTFGVILITLVGQGLTLSPLLRALGFDDAGGRNEEEEARLYTARAALSRLEQLVDQDGVAADSAEQVRHLYTGRAQRAAHALGKEEHHDAQEMAADYVRLRRATIAAQRQAATDLYRRGKLGVQGLRRLERDLDLEEERLRG